MRGIDRSLVDEAWRELAAYPPGRVETEADAFIAQQPHVAAFAETMAMGQDPHRATVTTARRETATRACAPRCSSCCGP